MESRILWRTESVQVNGGKQNFNFANVSFVKSIWRRQLHTALPGSGSWSCWRRQTATGIFCGNHKQQQQRDFSSSGPFWQQQRNFRIPFLNYFRSLKWTPIPLSLGFALLAYQHYKRVLQRVQHGPSAIQEEQISQDWEITFYRMVPWRTLSKAWGWVNSVNLPVWSRQYVLNWYVRKFNCDMSEAAESDLGFYCNLDQFFRRGLKTGVRPVDTISPLVSPADGKILHFGSVECGRIEQVKGVTYSLPAFLGPHSWDTLDSSEDVFTENISTTNSAVAKVDGEKFCTSILKEKAGTVLRYCVIYLAPGDYHHFHSPAKCDINFRRHFGGELLSVNPKIANWIPGLFSLNERAVYIGKWDHGFFSMTAVGATNVGSISVYKDPELRTNNRMIKKNTHQSKRFEKPLHFEKGDDFGEFNLGSTIVLLFEAPSSFKFNLEAGQRVRVGQSFSGEKSERNEDVQKKSAANATATELLLH